MDMNQPRQISVVEPIGAAIEKTKEILFRPFDIGKWFTIGFCAWLATLGDGGGGPNGNFGGGNSGASQDFQQGMTEFKNAVIENLPIIITVAAVIILFVLVLSILIAWLKSRGQFMFLHCVARNVAEVVNPWKQYARPANSLFIFKIVFGLIAFFCVMMPIGVTVILFLIVANNSVMAIGPLVGAILMGFVTAFVILFLCAIGMLVQDFVVPIMYIHNCGIKEGWQRFWAVCQYHKGVFALYLLFLIPIGLAIGMIVLLTVLGTCCLAACIFAIPYIGTVAMLPLLVWRRAYSVLFLAQFGPEFNVFPSIPEPVAVPNVDIPLADLRPPEPPQTQ